MLESESEGEFLADESDIDFMSDDSTKMDDSSENFDGEHQF